MSNHTTTRQSTTREHLINGAYFLAAVSTFFLLDEEYAPYALPVIGLVAAAHAFLRNRRHTRRATETWAPIAAQLRNRIPDTRLAGPLSVVFERGTTQVAVEYKPALGDEAIEISFRPRTTTGKLGDFAIMPTSLVERTPRRRIRLGMVPEFDAHFTVVGDDTTQLRQLWNARRQRTYADLVCRDHSAKRLLISFDMGALRLVRQGPVDLDALKRAVEFMIELASPKKSSATRTLRAHEGRARLGSTPARKPAITRRAPRDGQNAIPSFTAMMRKPTRSRSSETGTRSWSAPR